MIMYRPHHISSSFPSPEWIICGMVLPEGNPGYEVRILASKTLTQAEIEANFGHQDIFDGIFPVSSVIAYRDFILTTHMRDLVIIDGPDYAACLKHLFETWSPDKTERTAIQPSYPAIDGGQKQLES